MEVVFVTLKNFLAVTLSFEVIPFRGAYHALLGRPTHAKFMAIPCYMYLKLKVPGPNRVIMVSGDFKCAHDCMVANIDLAEAELAKIQKTADPEALSPSKKVK